MSNVPKLRFSGFSGEWEEKTLGQTVHFLDGQRKPIKESDRASMKGQYPYYGASGIIGYINDFIFDEDLILLGTHKILKPLKNKCVARCIMWLSLTICGRVLPNWHVHNMMIY